MVDKKSAFGLLIMVVLVAVLLVYPSGLQFAAVYVDSFAPEGCSRSSFQVPIDNSYSYGSSGGSYVLSYGENRLTLRLDCLSYDKCVWIKASTLCSYNLIAGAIQGDCPYGVLDPIEMGKTADISVPFGPDYPPSRFFMVGFSCPTTTTTFPPTTTTTTTTIPPATTTTSVPSACSADVAQCPDGSYVSRDPANGCQFRPCPAAQDWVVFAAVGLALVLAGALAIRRFS